MTYVGATPTTGDFKKCDSITTADNTATYNLRVGSVAVYPQSSLHCIVQVNGIQQIGGTNYNIVNDTIVFTSNLMASDVINQILILGNVNDIGTVSDDTVSTAKLQTDAVTQAKIADEAIDEARLQISNAGSNGQFLSKQSGNTGGLTWAAAGGAADDYFASLSAKDLGTGLHIKTSDTGASASNNAPQLVIEHGTTNEQTGISILSRNDMLGNIFFGDDGDDDIGAVRYNHSGNILSFVANAAERMRIQSDGAVLIGKTSATDTVEGIKLAEAGTIPVFTNADNVVLALNRQDDDGIILQFRQSDGAEGTVSVSGATIAYNTFCGTHWSRLADNSKPIILRGTVMESIATMCNWYQAVADVAESTDSTGNVTPAHQVKESINLPNGKSAGDAVTFTSSTDGKEYTGVYVKEDNEQLPMCKISDTADSKAVYGVFMCWDDRDDGLDGDVNDMNVAALGAFVVRIHKDETVAIGDYLQSKGDGTAKKQADDILRASTIAKVTSTEKTHIHADGSYCVPCTLHCG